MHEVFMHGLTDNYGMNIHGQITVKQSYFGNPIVDPSDISTNKK